MYSVSQSRKKELHIFETQLGYHFKDTTLLQAALLHPSFFRDKPFPFSIKIHFQRLEFLGDRFLSAVLGFELFKLFPEKREGFLSKAYMVLSQERTLVQIAKHMNIERFLQVAQPQIVDSILADAVEALIGGIWLDSNYETTRNCVLQWFQHTKEMVSNELINLNYKGQLQEFVGNRLHEIHYDLIKTWGPEHCRQFRCAVHLGQQLLAIGEGTSKQAAEELAAQRALKVLASLPR